MLSKSTFDSDTFSNIVYIGLKPNSYKILEQVPKVTIRFPAREENHNSTVSKKRSKNSSPKEGETGWISKKKGTGKTRKKVKAKSTKRKSTTKRAKSTKKSGMKIPRVSDSSAEVINILDDSSSDDDSNIGNPYESHAQSLTKRAKISKSSSLPLDDLESDSSENDFE